MKSSWQARAVRILGGLLASGFFGLLSFLLGRALVQGAVLNWIGAIAALLMLSFCALYAFDQALSGIAPWRRRWAEQLAGHAALMRSFGLRVTGIVLHGAGGECRAAGTTTPLRNSLIAWGGVLAQALLWALATRVAGRARDGFTEDLIWVFTVANPGLIVLNLIPLRPLDGALAWRLPLLFFGRSLDRERAAPNLRIVPKPQAKRDDRYLH